MHNRCNSASRGWCEWTLCGWTGHPLYSRGCRKSRFRNYVKRTCYLILHCPDKIKLYESWSWQYNWMNIYCSPMFNTEHLFAGCLKVRLLTLYSSNLRTNSNISANCLTRACCCSRCCVGLIAPPTSEPSRRGTTCEQNIIRQLDGKIKCDCYLGY